MSDSENLPGYDAWKTNHPPEPRLVCSACDEPATEDDVRVGGELVHLSTACADIESVVDAEEDAGFPASSLQKCKDNIDTLDEAIVVYEALLSRAKASKAATEKRITELAKKALDEQTEQAIAKLGLKEAP